MSLASDVSLPPDVTPAAALAIAHMVAGGVHIKKISAVVPDFTQTLLAAFLALSPALTRAVQSPALAAEYHRKIPAPIMPMMRVQTVTLHHTLDAPHGVASADRLRLLREGAMTDADVDELATALERKLHLAPGGERCITDYAVQQTLSGAPVPVVDGDDRHGPIAALIVPVPIDDAAYGLSRLVPLARDFLIGALRRALTASSGCRLEDAAAASKAYTVVEYAYGPIPSLASSAPASRAVYMRLLTPDVAEARRESFDYEQLLQYGRSGTDGDSLGKMCALAGREREDRARAQASGKRGARRGHD